MRTFRLLIKDLVSANRENIKIFGLTAFCLLFVNSAFLFIEIIQHDDCNFLNGGYRNYILAHQARLDRPLSGFIQMIVFWAFKFRDFNDFVLFRILSILLLSICGSLLCKILRESNTSRLKENFLIATSILFLPGFSYLVLLNLLSSETLGFCLSLLGGYFLCQEINCTERFSWRSALGGFVLILASTSIHQISSFYALIPFMIKVWSINHKDYYQLRNILAGISVVEFANLLNYLLNKKIIKPFLSIEWGQSVLLPLIPTHQSNFSIQAILDKIPDFFTGYLRFAGSMCWYSNDIVGTYFLSALLLLFTINIVVGNIRTKVYFLISLFGTLLFLFACFTPFLFSNGGYHFTRSIIPAQTLLILSSFFLLQPILKQSQLRFSAGVIFLSFFLTSTSNNFKSAVGLKLEYEKIRCFIIDVKEKIRNQEGQVIVFKPSYQNGNLLGNKLFADEWNFINSLVEGNFNSLAQIAGKRDGSYHQPAFTYVDPSRSQKKLLPSGKYFLLAFNNVSEAEIYVSKLLDSKSILLDSKTK